MQQDTFENILNFYMTVWRDGSAVKSMDWSSRGHGFDSQCPQGAATVGVSGHSLHLQPRPLGNEQRLQVAEGPDVVLITGDSFAED